jgi:type IV pilus assembly protein PilV
MKTQRKFAATLPARRRGFSLIEVMVALIIIAVGMLGIAKMQALALSTTESSGVRSLVAIEAASLAASMHANRDYWVAGPPPSSFTVSVQTTGPGTVATTVTDASGVLSATPNCATTTPCTPANLAAYDVQAWATALGQIVPAALATVTCDLTTPPLSCTIQVTWQENVSSSSNTTAAATSSAANLLNSPQYTLYVEP